MTQSSWSHGFINSVPELLLSIAVEYEYCCFMMLIWRTDPKCNLWRKMRGHIQSVTFKEGCESWKRRDHARILIYRAWPVEPWPSRDSRLHKVHFSILRILSYSLSFPVTNQTYVKLPEVFFLIGRWERAGSSLDDPLQNGLYVASNSKRQVT